MLSRFDPWSRVQRRRHQGASNCLAFWSVHCSSIHRCLRSRRRCQFPATSRRPLWRIRRPPSAISACFRHFKVWGYVVGGRSLSSPPLIVIQVCRGTVQLSCVDLHLLSYLSIDKTVLRFVTGLRSLTFVRWLCSHASCSVSAVFMTMSESYLLCVSVNVIRTSVLSLRLIFFMGQVNRFT